MYYQLDFAWPNGKNGWKIVNGQQNNGNYTPPGFAASTTRLNTSTNQDPV